MMHVETTVKMDVRIPDDKATVIQKYLNEHNLSIEGWLGWFASGVIEGLAFENCCSKCGEQYVTKNLVPSG